jgi:hypothetical protein
MDLNFRFWLMVQSFSSYINFMTRHRVNSYSRNANLCQFTPTAGFYHRFDHQKLPRRRVQYSKIPRKSFTRLIREFPSSFEKHLQLLDPQKFNPVVCCFFSQTWARHRCQE